MYSLFRNTQILRFFSLLSGSFDERCDRCDHPKEACVSNTDDKNTPFSQDSALKLQWGPCTKVEKWWNGAGDSPDEFGETKKTVLLIF